MREMASSDQILLKRVKTPLFIQILIVALLCLLNACGVAEGPAFLRFEGKVTSEEGQPLDGREVRIQLSPAESNHTPDDRTAGEVAHTHEEGKFAVETSRFAGGLLIIPMAVIMAPVGGVVAALTPWTFREVYDFLSPAYFVGSHCLPHPKKISLRIDSDGYKTTFVEEDIVQKLYRGKEQKNGTACMRIYDLGELKMSTGSTSR